jgi:SAM-dependent methyltransferase
MINWDVRYAKAVALLPELADEAIRVLEIGAGGGGLRRYLARPVVGIDLDPRLAAGARPWGVAARADRLPFSDRCFDVVLAMDVMEHLTAGERRQAIAEMVRTSRQRVLIGGPLGSFAAWGDAQYLEFRRLRGQPIPSWLAEHMALGIPPVADLLAVLEDLGLDYRLHGNETLVQHYAGVLADEAPFLSQVNATFRAKSPNLPPLGPDERDVPYSYIIDIAITPAFPLRSFKPAAFASVPPGQGTTSLHCIGEDVYKLPSIVGYTRFFIGDAASSELVAPDLCRDDAPCTIGDRRNRYGALTAIYSVWRNGRHGDHVGFCHDRRFFDFLGSSDGVRSTQLATMEDFHRHQQSIAAIDCWREALANGTIVIAMADTVQPNVAEHYMHEHFASHYLAAINLVLERHAQLRPFVRKQFASGRLYRDNMFICRADFFHELCDWLFDLLFSLENHVALPGAAQQHSLVFLAERLISLFLEWKFTTGTSRVELPVFILEEGVFS